MAIGNVFKTRRPQNYLLVAAFIMLTVVPLRADFVSSGTEDNGSDLHQLKMSFWGSGTVPAFEYAAPVIQQNEESFLSLNVHDDPLAFGLFGFANDWDGPLAEISGGSLWSTNNQQPNNFFYVPPDDLYGPTPNGSSNTIQIGIQNQALGAWLYGSLPVCEWKETRLDQEGYTLVTSGDPYYAPRQDVVGGSGFITSQEELESIRLHTMFMERMMVCIFGALSAAAIFIPVRI